MKKILLILIIQLVLVLSGCDSAVENKISELEQRISDLETENSDYRKSIEDLQQERVQLAQDYIEFRADFELLLEEIEDNVSEESLVYLESYIDENFTIIFDVLDLISEDVYGENFNLYNCLDSVEYLKAQNQILQDAIIALILELEKMPEWNPTSSELIPFSSQYQDDFGILNPDDSDDFTYTYIDEYNNIRFYLRLYVTRWDLVCSAEIVPPVDLGGGYFIPGGSDGCYGRFIAINNDYAYFINGPAPTTPEELGISVEELCSIQGLCYYLPDES